MSIRLWGLIAAVYAVALFRAATAFKSLTVQVDARWPNTPLAWEALEFAVRTFFALLKLHAMSDHGHRAPA